MEKRAANLLRYAVDRIGDQEVPLTQEQMATLLGVTREHVSRFVQKLKTAGVIETRRGGLSVRDAGRLNQFCCDCHDAVWEHYESVIKGVYFNEEQTTPAFPVPRQAAFLTNGRPTAGVHPRSGTMR